MEARLPVTLTHAVRYFIIRERSVEEAGRLIPGTRIRLEPLMRICVDSQLHDVAPFIKKGLTCCIIISETGTPGLIRKLHALKNFEVVK